MKFAWQVRVQPHRFGRSVCAGTPVELTSRPFAGWQSQPPASTSDMSMTQSTAPSSAAGGVSAAGSSVSLPPPV